MGNSASSSESDDELRLDCKEDDNTSDIEVDTEKDGGLLDLGALFEPTTLRSAAAKVKDELPENILQQHHAHLIRWLEERQQRNEEIVTLAQFYDVLSRSVGREDCIAAFQRFDIEGDGTADVAGMIEALKASNSASNYGELGYVVRTLQACSLTPGFIDVYTEDKQSIGHHGRRLLNFLLRNRAPSSLLPFPILSGFSNTTEMRLAALNAYFQKLKETASQQEDTILSNGEELRPISRCFNSIEVSTNKADSSKLLNTEMASYWQSDGSARSHWIRMRIKSNVVIKELSIGVASSDQSYMPQQVAVCVGKNIHALREIKEVRIPNHVTGDISLIEGGKVHHPMIQINIKRCHSDGCDTRIHYVKSVGYRIVKESGVSVMDASAAWYLQVLASTASACLTTSPQLNENIIQHTMCALRHMGPLSLAPASSERPALLSQHVLKQMDDFLTQINKTTDESLLPKGLLMMLGFNLARGSVTGIISTLIQLQEHPSVELECASMLHQLEFAKESFWRKQATLVNVSLAGCDGGQKEETAGPTNVLTGNWSTSLPYLSGDGKTRVNMFFTSQDYLQLTKLRIKVEKGPRGPRRGFVFVYSAIGDFNLPSHVSVFEKYNSWTDVEFRAHCLKRQEDPTVDDGPVGYFSLEDEWDEVEINLDGVPLGQYVCVKFLEPRQDSAERLGIVGVKFYGYLRKGVFVKKVKPIELPEKHTPVPSKVICQHVLRFLVSLSRDQSPPSKSGLAIPKPQHLEMSDLSLDLVWKLYEGFTNKELKNLCLQLLHALFPFIASSKHLEKDPPRTFFDHLCELVDNNEDSTVDTVSSKSCSAVKKRSRSRSKSKSRSISPDKSSSHEPSFSKDVGKRKSADQDTPPKCSPKSKEKKDNSGKNRNKALALEKPEFECADRRLVSIAKQVIIDGAAVFFPDKEARRKQLFNMMSNVHAGPESPSVSLTFQSLCQFFSAVDPSGLLDLPKPAVQLSQEFDESSVLAVLETLVSVADREFNQSIMDFNVSPQSEHLVDLLCSLQTSLLSWCHQQIVVTGNKSKSQSKVAQTLLAHYLVMLSARATKAMKKVVSIFKKEIFKMEDMLNLCSTLNKTYVSMVMRQLVLSLTHLSNHLSSVYRVRIARSLVTIAVEMAKLSPILPQVFYAAESSEWQQINSGEVVLRTWEVESTHNYENNQHITQMFSCPGATTFIVEFDPRCETEKRYDYLEFTDARGVRTKYDQKVGTEKWPNLVVFRGGHKLQFLFHSDSSNNEWGYKFKVRAKGCPDVPLNWMFDLHLSMAKLFGRLCGSTLDVTAVLPKWEPNPENIESTELEMLKSELWATLLRGGYMVGKLQRSLSGKHVAVDDAQSASFLWRMVERDAGLGTEMLNKLEQGCPTSKLGGPELTEAITAVFAALLWHTQSLRDDITKYVKAGGISKISDGITQAYNAAEGLRTFLIEQRQKLKLANENSSTDPDMISACKEKALFLLKFAGLTKVHLRTDTKPKLDRRASRQYSRSYKLDSLAEKHPSFKLVLDFVRDPLWDKQRVEELLKERSQQAQAVSEIYLFMAEYIRIMTDQHIFQLPIVVFLQEILVYQDKFARHYAEGLDGCGLELETQVRQSYYTLIRRLVESMRSTHRFNLNRSVVQCYDYVEACMLHILDVNWQMYDLDFLVEINLPQLFMDLAIGSVSMREKIDGDCNEEEELKEYARHRKWLQLCQHGFFDWYDKMSKGECTKDDKKDLQMFIACYCDLLDVEISCDGCGVTLPGSRYRCLQCHDMDLCTTCYAGGVKPAGDHTDDHDIVHLSFKCDECQGFIQSTRIHCNVCEDFDLCLGCHREGIFPGGHSTEHAVTRIPITKWRLNKESDSSILSYIHQHVWLQFTSLALSMANHLYSTSKQCQDLDYIKAATTLHNQCIDLATKCLMSVGGPDDPANSASSLSLKGETDESLVVRQQEAFAIHSQERMMGLLGAMIPIDSKTPLAEDVSSIFTSEEFFTMLFNIARGDTEHEVNTQHLAMGLISQLLQKTTTTCQVVDVAVRNTTTGSSRDLLALNTEQEGVATAEFLFQFGATCLERSGLEWANSMANILQNLFNTVAWREVLMTHVTSSLTNLHSSPRLSAIFALFVIAGYPEVLSIGSHVKYVEGGTEVKHGVVIKHFPDKNQCLLVDKKSRKRRTLKDEQVECIKQQVQVLDSGHLSHFIMVINDITQIVKANLPSCSVESLWVLSLTLKALLRTIDGGCSGQELYSQQFVQSVVYLASQGTGFSRQWLLKDFEILSLMLYTREKEGKNSAKEQVEPDTEDATVSPSDAAITVEGEPLDPLEGLDETTRMCFQTINEHLNVPVSVLRALYEIHGQSTNNLLMVVHEKVENTLDDTTYVPSEEVKKLAKRWEARSCHSASEFGTEDATDTGMQLVTLPIFEHDDCEVAAAESEDATQKLIPTCDNDVKCDTSKQKKHKSASLLKRELELQGKTGSRDFMIKLNLAMSVLYSRKVLTALLAEWPSAGPPISADLLGCRENPHIPFVLDLLNRTDNREAFQKVVQNVIKHSAPAALIPIATTSCQFMEEVNLSTVSKETEHPYKNNTHIEDKVVLPGASILSIKFDNRCCTEETCDELIMSSSEDYTQDRCTFSGPSENHKWKDFEMPGNTLYFKFSSDCSNCDWGYKFTVTGGRLGRFDTGYRILNGILSLDTHLKFPQEQMWKSLVYVACKQTGEQRLKAIQLLLKIISAQDRTKGAKTIDLGLLAPLWHLYNKSMKVEPNSGHITAPVVRALTELFLLTENLAMDWECTSEYVANLKSIEDIQLMAYQGLRNIAAISNEIGYSNKATEALKPADGDLVRL